MLAMLLIIWVSVSSVTFAGEPALVDTGNQAIVLDKSVAGMVPQLIFFNDFIYSVGKKQTSKYENYLRYFTDNEWKIHVLQGISGKEIKGSLSDAPVVIGYKDGVLVICFRGSQSISAIKPSGEKIQLSKDWDTNLSKKTSRLEDITKTLPAAFSKDLQQQEDLKNLFDKLNIGNFIVHEGFALRTMVSMPSIINYIEKYRKIGLRKVLVTGHSQGSALGTIALAVLAQYEKSITPNFANADSNKYSGYFFSSPRSIYTFNSAKIFEDLVGKGNVVHQNCENDPVPHAYIASENGYMDVGHRALDSAAKVKNRRALPNDISILGFDGRTLVNNLIAFVHYGSNFNPLFNYHYQFLTTKKAEYELTFDPLLADSTGRVSELLKTIIPDTKFHTFIKVDPKTLESIDNLLARGQASKRFWFDVDKVNGR